MEYKSKLHESTVKYPQSQIWMDSCGAEELAYGIERGCVGATCNPNIVTQVIKNELDIWTPVIRKIIEENPEYNEDDVSWALIDEIGRQRSQLLLPIFTESGGKLGRLSIQTNIKNYRNTERMLEQAIHLNELGENMQVKLPASEAGVKAMEEATYRGISINATVSFTVSQAVAVAEAVERGLERRKKEGLSCAKMTPVCTIMAGRVDDWLKSYTTTKNLAVAPESLEWAGIAVEKEAYRVYNEKNYTTKLLTAANRNPYHWSEFVGGDIRQTINYGWQKKLESCDFDVVSRIDHPVHPEYMRQLKKYPEFMKAFENGAQNTSEFTDYGAFKFTLNGFLTGYEDLVKLVRPFLV